ncbi:hypothetical protein MKZ38_007695 [Zalerion maritima]|uniref:FAR1 domain-containing protein n=1 Tax=Zalerion maritima TaxID=339359 RepID=A0AAD5WMV3_9PEZI|nr:hypothetical protein MKZ38_007695 [Zalerion maritima]
MLSPVPSNVQPNLTMAGPTGHNPNDYVNMRENMAPIMSTPGAHGGPSHNVRIEPIQPPHHQSPSVNSTDPTRTQNHIFAPHTVPSNGFNTAPHAPVSVPSSVPPIHSSVPGVPVSTAGHSAQHSHPYGHPHGAVPISSSATPTPPVTAPAPPQANPAPVQRTSSRRRSPVKPSARRGKGVSARRAAISQTSNSHQADDNDKVSSAQAQAQNQAHTSHQANNSLDSSQQHGQNANLAQFTPASEAPQVPAVGTPTLPSLNSNVNNSMMPPSPVPPPASNSGNGPSGGNAQLLPPPEGIYRSFDELLRAVQQMAKDQGYGVVKLRASNYRDGKPTRYDLVCDRGGVKYSSTAKKRNPSTRKVDCPWRAKAVCEVQLGNQWRFQVQDQRHNHEPRIQAAMPGVEQTPTSQYLRTICNKLDRMNHDLSESISRMGTQMEAFDKRIESIEATVRNWDARLNSIESQRMEMDMEVESRLLAGSSIMPGSQQPEPGQAGQSQMASFTYTGP